MLIEDVSYAVQSSKDTSNSHKYDPMVSGRFGRSTTGAKRSGTTVTVTEVVQIRDLRILGFSHSALSRRSRRVGRTAEAGDWLDAALEHSKVDPKFNHLDDELAALRRQTVRD
jgi:hypothetical protein